MVRQVVIDRAWSDGPCSGEGECRERVRVVERGDLGDHAAYADAREVRQPVVEFAGKRRGVGCKMTQRVRRSLGIDSGRRAGIAQVVSHDVSPAARERHAERVGPGEHGRAACEQNQRRRRVTEVLDPERDSVRLDRRHHDSDVAKTPPDVRHEWIVKHIVNLQVASWTGRAIRRVEHTRPGLALRDGHRRARNSSQPYPQRALRRRAMSSGAREVLSAVSRSPAASQPDARAIARAGLCLASRCRLGQTPTR
jgi:hypothetical protein